MCFLSVFRSAVFKKLPASSCLFLFHFLSGLTLIRYNYLNYNIKRGISKRGERRKWRLKKLDNWGEPCSKTIKLLWTNQEKALDRSQEPLNNIGGELINRNSGYLEGEPSRAAPQPEESKTQPDFPANVQLYFNIDG